MTCPWCMMEGLWFLSVGQCNGFPLKPSWCVWEPFGNFKHLDALVGNGTWCAIILFNKRCNARRRRLAVVFGPCLCERAARHDEPWWTAFKAGRGVAQVKLDACYAAEYAPALPAARLVGMVELSSNPRSMYAMLTEGFWALPSKSNCRVSSSPEPLSLTTLRTLHGAVSL